MEKERKKEGLLKSASKLASASFLAQIISLVALPFISRAYSKEDIGVAGIVMTLATLLSFLASGSYGQAIVISRRHVAQLLLPASLCYSFFLSILLGVLLFLLRGALAAFLPTGSGFAQILPYWYWVPFLVFFLSAYMILAGYANHQQRYGRLALANLWQSGTTNGMKVGLGLLGASSATALITSSTIGGVAGLATLFGVKSRSTPSPHITARRMKLALYYNRNFPLYSSPMMLVNSLVATLLIVALPRWYGLAELGLITMASQVTSRPLSLVTEAFSRVYCRDFAGRVAERKPLLPVFWRFARYFFIVVLPASILLYALMPWLVTFLLGDKWQDLVPIVRAMIPFLALGSINSIFNFLPEIFRKQRRLLVAYLLILFYQFLLLVLIASNASFSLFYTLYYKLVLVVPVLFMVWLYCFMVRYDKALHTK